MLVFQKTWCIFHIRFFFCQIIYKLLKSNPWLIFCSFSGKMSYFTMVVY